MLTAALSDGSVVLVNLESGKISRPVLKFEKDAYAAAWSPDGAWLLACGPGGAVGVWSAKEGKTVNLDPRVLGQLVYVVLTDDGSQETYTPAAFAAKFGWKYDPSKVTLTPAE